MLDLTIKDPPLQEGQAAPRFDLSAVRGFGIVALIVIFGLLLAVWYFFHRGLPQADDASYTLDSFKFAALFRHPKLWLPDWWHRALTLNPFYPPFVFAFNGLLRVVLGGGLWVAAFSEILFAALLSATVYGATRLFTSDRTSAILAAITINLYPIITSLQHGFLLDAPLTAMISLGLFTLAWWHSKPSWIKAGICGIVLGLACLTKQIAAAYLFLPGVYFFVAAAREDLKARQMKLTGQLFGVAALTGLVGLPWLLTNAAFIKQWSQANQANMGHRELAQVFPYDVCWYITHLPTVMSPLLFILFCASLLFLGANLHKRLLPAGLCALGGVLSLCTLTWAFPDLRYETPALIAASIYSGTFLSALYKRGALSRALVLVLLFIASVQFISFNYCPYPIATPKFMTAISEKLGVNLKESIGSTARDFRESQQLHSNPQPAFDWGQDWAIATIDRFEPRHPVYLNILPDLNEINVHTFEIVAHSRNSAVTPTTSRYWTISGDKVSFDPVKAQYYQWYLLKSGQQGNILQDESSDRDYQSLLNFVEHSGSYRLIAQHKLGDGSIMYLYRQN